VKEIELKHHVDLIDGKLAFSVNYKIQSSDYNFEVLELAKSCIERWNLFMKDNSLPIN